MNFSPQDVEQFSQWLAVLGKPTVGVILVVVVILYRGTVEHIIKGLFDVVFKRK